MPDWLDEFAMPMLIESHHVCDDGTNVTTQVSRVESFLILDGQRRIRLPLVGPRTYSDGSNHFRRETYGLIRIELAGRPPITCSPAPPEQSTAERGPTTDPDTFWADPPGPPMIIESHHVCDDGTNVTTLVSRVQTVLVLNGRSRVTLPAIARRSYSDGSNHFWIEPYGLIRIELAGRPLITCSPAPIAEPQ